MSLITVAFTDGKNIRIKADSFYKNGSHYWRTLDGKNEMMYDIAYVASYKINGKWHEVRRRA